MENKLKRYFNIAIVFLWIISFIYIVLILIPPSVFMQSSNFRIDGTKVWQYAYINLKRNARISLQLYVIEEINRIHDWYIEVVHRKERGILTEKGNIAVRRKMDYVFTETWTYNLNLTIVHNISDMLHLQKITILKDTFEVK